ncbi:membrane protein [Clostridium carboxidivorans P7]|uniref:YetF C-terminal domain-containing protein n=1 Tax=Clostridium carboxidivorans P7 TaxID=536227 RepID=C6PZH9_9CLOT|nr:DUF421 domain-containing protein [Clostridium carboxidivorans]AKN33345.1 membrane protein [Clostridium carboxidivorans P7]EET85368.1 protein of unknown function DUF421 [Clostridium carboxidivorans P7]EFG89280.1 hypothetical protein CLCAR_1166 [Clostridium carboxidivorans P7]
MFTVLIRTAILYFLVIISMRLMGKKQIGELQPFELAITIMISELASFPMQDTRIPIIHGVIAIITLLLIQTILSVLELKSEKVRLLLNGKPSILINNGKIDIKELRRQQFNINDLMEELRLQGHFNLDDIHFAILETSGQLSIIPKTNLAPATKGDLKVPFKQDTIPVTLILDGSINHDNLKILNKDENWLNEKLKRFNIDSPKEVFIALIDSQGSFYYQKKV